MQTFGNQYHTDQNQETQGQHLEGRVTFDKGADPGGKDDHDDRCEDHREDHHRNLIDHTDGCDNGIERKDEIKQ